MWQNRSAMGAGSVAVFTSVLVPGAQWAPHQSLSWGRMRGSDGGGSYLQLAVRADLTERAHWGKTLIVKVAVWPSADREYQAEKSKQHWPWKNEAGGLQNRREPLTPKSNSFFPVSTSADALTFTACLLLLKSLLRWSPFTTLLDLLCQQPLQTFSLGLSLPDPHFLWFPSIFLLLILGILHTQSSHSVLSSPNQKLSLFTTIFIPTA